MLDKKEISLVLEKCLDYGCEFAELYFEDTIKNVIELTGDNVTKANSKNVYGVGLRLLDDEQEVYGYLNNVNFDSLIQLANRLGSSFDGKAKKKLVELMYEDVYINHLAKISDISNEQKINYLREVRRGATEYSDEITQTVISFTDNHQDILICNTEGLMKHDKRLITRIYARVIASNDGVMQTGTTQDGGNVGFEFYENLDLLDMGRTAAKAAVTMLHADEMVGQTLPVVIHNGFGGVILHEACVHSLEAHSVGRGLSVFCGKLGEKIASDIVNATDDGTIENAWGSGNIDDEGTPRKRNVLIENGVLKSYLVDRKNSKKMNHHITGSSRRESYRYMPTARMTNTFFENGNSTFEEIIANTNYGLFAKSMGGGSVNPTTGEFNFVVNEGYMIIDGKIDKPVRGATLVGQGKDVLFKIDMIANNLKRDHGMCGAASGSIPADVGQPTIRVSSMTVGGKGGNK